MENVRYMISDAANIVNVESHVLRYWEEELELQIPRNEMGHRYYTEENIAQFQKIKEWKEQGYQLKAIRMMIHSSNPEQELENYAAAALKQKPENYSENLSGQRPENYGANNVIRMNREYMETVPGAMMDRHENPVSNTVKLEQFQSMMLTIVKQAVEENNQALGREVGYQVEEKVIKEMNYLMRVQDEAEEERFRKLDAAIRTYRKGKRVKEEKPEKAGRFSRKEKKLNPNLSI